MARTTPLQTRSQQRIQSLHTAARELIDDPAVGRDRFTTAQIAEKSGASIGTVYRYFEDRVAVLDELYPDRDRVIAVAFLEDILNNSDTSDDQKLASIRSLVSQHQ